LTSTRYAMESSRLRKKRELTLSSIAPAVHPRFRLLACLNGLHERALSRFACSQTTLVSPVFRRPLASAQLVVDKSVRILYLASRFLSRIRHPDQHVHDTQPSIRVAYHRKIAWSPNWRESLDARGKMMRIDAKRQSSSAPMCLSRAILAARRSLGYVKAVRMTPSD
jgi:hypothetical protein